MSVCAYCLTRRAVQTEIVYVRCVVPRCLVRTRVPNEYGMCSVILWDEAHDAYFEQMRRVA